MLAALADTVYLGIDSSIGYLADVLTHPAFVAGETTTDFLDTHMADAPSDTIPPDAVIIAAALAQRRPRAASAGDPGTAQPSAWQTLGGWRIGGA